MRAICSSFLSFPNLISIIVFDQEYKLWTSGFRRFSYSAQKFAEILFTANSKFSAIFYT